MPGIQEYVSRTVDIVGYHGVQPTGDNQLDATLAIAGEGGRIVTGVQKLVQRFLVELFRERGSTLFRPDEGTTFLVEARSGNFRTPNDVIGAFARAAAQVKTTLQQDESDDDPNDERFGSAEVLSVTLEGARVSLRVSLLSRAGTDRIFIFPIAVSI